MFVILSLEETKMDENDLMYFGVEIAGVQRVCLEITIIKE